MVMVSRMNGAELGEFAAGLDLRPRRPGELLDVAMRLTRVVLRKVAPWVLLAELPFAVVAVLWIASLGGDDAGRTGWSLGILTGMAVPAIMFVTAITMVAVHDAHLGRDVSGGRSAIAGLKRLPILVLYCVVGSVVYSVISFVLMIGVSIPMGAVNAIAGLIGGPVRTVVTVVIGLAGFIVWSAVLLGQFGRFMVGLVAVIVERRGPFDAFSRGWDLSRKQWVRNGVLLLLATMFAYVVLFILATVVAWLGGSGRGALSIAVTSGVYFVLFGLLAFPFWAALSVAMFVDGRVRREALDIEQLLTGLGPVSV
jgi:hypothetical protein